MNVKQEKRTKSRGAELADPGSDSRGIFWANSLSLAPASATKPHNLGALYPRCNPTRPHKMAVKYADVAKAANGEW